ncbi:glycosyltransferase [Saccharicrinis sp. FJH62]|uniref:glycosyltransferase n=1 Tax=Saccharicrinis sp. FJH62 TaxID=3344657 RepID=UPI0035D3FF19
MDSVTSGGVSDVDLGLAIIVPCYNESRRLNPDEYASFLKKQYPVKIIFSNDGSTDDTLIILQKIQDIDEKRVFIHTLDQNKGKAMAIFEGYNYCTRENISFDKLAYLDADGATSLEECYELSQKIKDNVVFVFGSRILKIDNNINRKRYRHLLGRVIATFISIQLDIKVYDTQCGCKIFEKQLASKVFKERFISRWLFDVEIFHRILKLYGRKNIKAIAREVPLQRWIDPGESKVSFAYGIKLWFDLLKIGRKYRQ